MAAQRAVTHTRSDIRRTACTRLPTGRGLEAAAAPCVQGISPFFSLQTSLRSALGLLISPGGAAASHHFCAFKTLPTLGGLSAMRGEYFSPCLKAQRPKPEVLKEVSCSPCSALGPLPGCESCAAARPGIPSPTAWGLPVAVGFLPLFDHRSGQEEQDLSMERHRESDPAACWGFNLVPSRAGAFQQGYYYLFISYMLYLCKGKV